MGVLQWDGAHPASEASATVGGVNPKMGEVNGGSGGLGWGGDENGKVAYGGNLVCRGRGQESSRSGVRDSEGVGWGEVPGKALV